MNARRTVTLAMGFGAAALLVPALQAGAPQEAGERTIYVSVMAGNGAPVTDLTQADFTVKEDDAAREIVRIEKATDPVHYVLLVDTTPAATSYVQYLRDALTAFVKTVLGASPSSQIAFVEFGGAAVMSRGFTSTLAELEAAIPRLLPRPSEPVFNEAMVEAAKQLGAVTGRRRCIVTINMEPNNESSSIQAPQVAAAVQKSGATVWAISVQTGTRRDANRDQMLIGLSNNTGGLRTTIQTPVPLPDFMRSIAANTLLQYAVTFRRPEGAAPAKMTAVAVARPGVRAMTLMWSDR